MIETRLDERLMELSFHRGNSNTEGVYFYYRVEGNGVSIISAIHDTETSPITAELYGHITDQIKDAFFQQGFHNLVYLGLLFTPRAEKCKEIYMEMEEDAHWLIDTRGCKLRIYENQPSDFIQMKGKIEEILELSYLEALEQSRSELKQKDLLRFTWINTIIIALNILFHVMLYYFNVFGDTQEAISSGALSWKKVLEEGQYFRLITSMFIHGDIQHIFNNMLVLLFIGEKLERTIGRKKYLFLYLASGIIAGISSMGYNKVINDNIQSIGASGAVFGVVGALLYIIIRCRGRVEEIGSRQIILFVIISLYGGFTSVGIDNVAHIGGLIAGILLAILIYRKPKEPLD